MAIRLYDEALVRKISKWVKDPNMRILKPDEVTRLFQIQSDEQKDKGIKLPLIAISRDRDIEITSTSKQPKSFSGFKLGSSEEVGVTLDVIPITINYQIDIYTTSMESADEYVRNFVFKLINSPRLRIDIPYLDMDLVHNANIDIDSTISDNSDINERLFSDQFTRFTLKLSISDAYLFSVNVQDTIKLESIEVETMEHDTKEIESQGVIYEEEDDD